MRLFVAIALPEEAWEGVALLRAGLPGAKWVEPSSLHVTLRFIGEVDGGKAEDIARLLSGVMAPMFELTLSGLGHFGSSGRAHSLWLGVERQPSLQALQEKVEAAVVRAGQASERRKFKPHVTLARFRDPEAGARLGAYLQRHGRVTLPPFWVRQFTLFRSHLGGEGPHYEPIVDYFLEPGRGVAAFPPF